MNAPHVKATGLLFSICAACAAFLLFVIPLSAEAARLVPFIPSETLNPDCGPNDPNCYVQPFVVQDEGVSMTNFARGLNFIGGGVQVTADNAGIISVRVTRGPVAVGEINWNEFRSSGIRLATSTYQVLIGANSTTSLAKLEVVGDQVIRGGFLGIGTTSPFKELSVVGSAWFTGTANAQKFSVTGNSGTSTFNGISGDLLNITGNSTSTFNRGIDLASGCFSINGSCLSNNASGLNRQVQFNNNGSFDAEAAFTYNPITNTLRIDNLIADFDTTLNALTFVDATGTKATTTSFSTANLSVTGNSTSTFNKGINLSSGCFSVGGVCVGNSTTSPAGLNRQIQFNNNGFFGSDIGFTYNSNTNVLSVPNIVVTGAATTTLNAGLQTTNVSLLGSATSTAVNGFNLTGGCFSVNGTCVGGATSPAGSNRQIQFNQAGSFGADAGFTYNVNTNTLSSQNLVISGGATSTDLFTTTASTSNLFATTARLGTTTIGSLTVSGSATTTFGDSIAASSINLYGQATSSAQNGINISSGCFSVNGACVGGGAGTPAGLNRQIQFNNNGSFGADAGFTYNSNTSVFTAPKLTVSAGSTLSGLTFATSTGISATTTNSFATIASSTNFFSTAANIGNTNITGLLTAANVIALGSTTLQNFTFTSATGTSATTTNFSTQNLIVSGSGTSTFVGGGQFGAIALVGSATSTSQNGINISSGCFSVNGTCVGGGATNPGGANRQVQFNQNGSFGGDAGFTYNTTSNILTVQKLLVGASTTLSGFTFATSTGLAATTTNSFATIASSTNLFSTTASLGITSISGQLTASSILSQGSTTLQGLNFISATGTSATTTNFSTSKIAVTGSATSSFVNGINLTSGCFSVGGTCISAGVVGGGTPAGGDTQLQFNDSGAFAGDSTLSFDKNTKILSANSINVSAGTNLNGLNFATSTGTSATTTNSFSVNQIVNNLQVNGLSTTTFVNNGINLNGGCFAVRGSCVFGGDGGPATIAGLNRQIQYNKNGSFGADAEFTYFDTTDTLNTGNIVLTGQFSVPIADISNVLRVSNSLSVVGGLTVIDNRGVIANGLRVTGSATSSFNNGIDLNNGCLAFNGLCSQIITTDSNLSVNSVNVSDSYKIGGRNFISGTNESNTFIGKFAGAGNLVGVGGANTFIGYAAGSSTVNTGANVAIGYYAMANSSAGTENIAIGNYSLMNTSFVGNANTAIGNQTLYNNTDGNHNTAIGQLALRDNTVGYANAAIGDSALSTNISGGENVAIGYHAGMQNTTGSYNTFIGFNAGSVSPNNISKSVGIGWNASPGASNVVVFGSATLFNEVNVGIGTNTPLYRLQVKNLSGTDVAKFEGNNGTFCTLNSNSGLSCTSDERLKKDIVEISASSSLQSVMSLRPVAYRWLFEDEASSTHSGFIAQEVERVLPELITIDNESGYRALSTVGLIPILTNAMQEQQRIIDDLKIKLEGLATTTTQRDFVNGLVRASDKGVSIVGDVYIDGHVLLGRDSAGIVAIASGEISKEVRFNGVYNKKPVVVVTPRELLPDNISYYVTTNNESFTIVLSKPSQSKITFSWIAVEGAVEEVVDDIAPAVIDNATNTPQDVIDPPQVDNGDSNLIDTPPEPIDIPVDQVAPVVDVIQNADAQ